MDHLSGLGELLSAVLLLVLIIGGGIALWIAGLVVVHPLQYVLLVFVHYLLGPLLILAGTAVIVADGTSGGGWNDRL